MTCSSRPTEKPWLPATGSIRAPGTWPPANVNCIEPNIWGLLTSVAYSPDGRHIVSLGRNTDSAIRVMDTLHYQVERRYQAHALCGAMILYSPDGRWMASASDDESVRRYDLNQVYAPRSFAAPW
jgi:WD40 repeat protein